MPKQNIPWKFVNLEIVCLIASFYLNLNFIFGCKCNTVPKSEVWGDTHTEEQIPSAGRRCFCTVSPPDRPPLCLAASSPVFCVRMPPLHPLGPVSYLDLGLDWPPWKNSKNAYVLNNKRSVWFGLLHLNGALKEHIKLSSRKRLLHKKVNHKNFKN